MDTSVRHRRKTWLRRIALGAMLGLALVAVAMGVAVYHFFNDRPGEGALRLVPANALLAISIDLSPSASQAGVFKKIDDALARNNLKGFLESSFADLLDQGKNVPELRDLATRSGAFALLAPDGTDKKADPTVFFLGLTDGPRAAQALSKACKLQFLKGTRYYLPKTGGLAMSVVGDVLVVSSNPANLHAVQEVAEKEKPGMVATPEFAAARASLDSDANVMFFLNPAMLKTMDPSNDQASKIADSVGWVAFGVAARDGGVALSVHCSMDAAKFSALNALADLKPLRSDLYKLLPSGAYGAVALSQEGTLIDVAMSIAEELGAKDAVAKLRKDFADGTGIDIKNDAVPNLQGNTAVALYPSEGVEVGGVDILALVDDQNGADPAKLAESLRVALDKSYQDKEKKGPLMVKIDDPEGAGWGLSPDVEQAMQKGLGDTFNVPEVKGELLSSGKTVLFTTRGKTVFLSTSRKLMERALKTYKTGTDSVADEAALAQPNLLDGSQEILVFDLAKIAKGVEATLNFDKMEQEPANVVKGILAMFETLDTPLSAKCRLSSATLSGSVFIPLDYDRFVDFVGAQVHKDRPTGSAQSKPSRT